MRVMKEIKSFKNFEENECIHPFLGGVNMRQDLSTELHLQKFDVNHIKTVIIQNTARLLNIVRQHDDFLISNGINIPNYKGFTVAMLSEISENNKHQNNCTKQNQLAVNGQCVAEDNIDRCVVTIKDKSNGKQYVDRIPQQKSIVGAASGSLASDLGWGSNDEEENHKTKSAEIQSCPTRLSLDSELPVSWENDFWIDKSREVESSAGDVEFLYETRINCEDIPEDEITPQCHNPQPTLNRDSLPIESTVKSLRCYSRRKSKADLSSITKETNSLSNQVNPKVFDSSQENVITINDEDKSEPAVCVISEVTGNAVTVFSEVGNPPENVEEFLEIPLITPKKTNDITKIKGWRRKQFFVEKPTTVEFFRYENQSSGKRVKIENISEIEETTSENVENAFVCNSLDEFLDNDAELNIEIPHLYAEVGIKLTSDEVASRPNLSDKDVKEVETKYCVAMELTDNNIWGTEDSKRGIKRNLDGEIKAEKLEEKRTITTAQKEIDELRPISRPRHSKSNFKQRPTNGPKILTSFNRNTNNVTLISKLIGLVVYPGSQPLHPLVRHHLKKLRSYRTKIDKNWANFAASAVLSKDIKYRRSILPVYLCGKVEASEAASNVERLRNPLTSSTSTELESSSPIEFSKQNGQSTSVLKKSNVKLKECRVVINRINTDKITEVWCMEHNCYNCMPCGLLGIVGQKNNSNKSGAKDLKSNSIDSKNNSVSTSVSSQPYFDKSVADLLAKKLRSIKKKQSSPSASIDVLKTLPPNSVELVKLNFIKQSFLIDYINIWYLKSTNNGTRSRAFLTFSQTPPVPNAINLKSNTFSSESLPKVITEIVSPGKQVDSNGYAVIHFSNNILEIHGILKIDGGKKEAPSKKRTNIEHIFTTNFLPEIVKLQEIALSILKLDHAKWWVLDLSQKFDNLEIFSASRILTVSRKKLVSFVKAVPSRFVSIRNDFENRSLGVFMSLKLLPFVLIGPYFLTENSGLSVKIGCLSVPFSYSSVSVSDNLPLKFFINSVILEYRDRDTNLEGLWLCDRVLLDNTCYLEVLSSNRSEFLKKHREQNKTKSKEKSIANEHDYSLKSVVNCFPESKKRVENAEKSSKEIKVYLYFEIFALGYVEGLLQPDNSVVIAHPLDKGTKVMSQKIGDWFIGIIKRRIRFMPKDLKIRWFITKFKEDLRGRKLFNKFFLGGAHILCSSGLYFMLGMTDSKIKELGLNKKEITTAIAKSKVINEALQLKGLARLLKENSSSSDHLSMKEVLALAIDEIKNLKNTEDNLFNKKGECQKEKLRLGSLFLDNLYSYNSRDTFRIGMIKKVIHFFEDERGRINEDFVKIIRKYRFGRKYLRERETPYHSILKCSEMKSKTNASDVFIGKIKHRVSMLLERSKMQVSTHDSEELEKGKDLRNITEEPLIVERISNESNLDLSETLESSPESKKQFLKLNSNFGLPKNVKVSPESFFRHLHSPVKKAVPVVVKDPSGGGHLVVLLRKSSPKKNINSCTDALDDGICEIVEER